MARSYFGSFNDIVKFTAANFAALGGFLAYYLPNSLFLDSVKEFTQVYRKMEPAELTEKLTNICNTVVEETSIPVSERSKIEFYHVYGFKPVHFGCTLKLPLLGGFNRGIIGIPLTFDLESPNFHWRDVMIRGKNIPWSTEAANQLKDSFTLSEKAIKFAIAEQLYHVQTNEILLKASFTAMVGPLLGLLANAVELQLNKVQKNRALQVFAYSFILVVVGLLWFNVTDTIRCVHESKVDNAIVATLRKEYIEGGLEYFEKELLNNLAVRELLGEKGPKTITLFGNEVALIRQKHLPLTYRRDFFKEKLDEFA